MVLEAILYKNSSIRLNVALDITINIELINNVNCNQ
jgi:hypothetical protein